MASTGVTRVPTEYDFLTPAREELYRKILSVILWRVAKTREGVQPLPTVKEFIYGSLATAIHGFLNGFSTERFIYRDIHSPDHPLWEGQVRSTRQIMLYEVMVWRELCVDLVEKQYKLHPKLWSALLELFNPRFRSPAGLDEGGSSPLLYSTFRSRSICEITMPSTFIPNLAMQDTVEKASKELPADLVEQCEAIGDLLRNHIVHDVEYIRLHYRW